MKLQITVEREHWDRGVCQDPGKCAIANALHEVFFYVNVVPDSYIDYFNTDGGFIEGPISKEASNLAIKFDKRAPFPGPTTFTIDVPQKVIDSIDISDIEKAPHLKLIEA